MQTGYGLVARCFARAHIPSHRLGDRREIQRPGAARMLENGTDCRRDDYSSTQIGEENGTTAHEIPRRNHASIFSVPNDEAEITFEYLGALLTKRLISGEDQVARRLTLGPDTFSSEFPP